jgi:hypothetical protein
MAVYYRSPPDERTRFHAGPAALMLPVVATLSAIAAEARWHVAERLDD